MSMIIIGGKVTMISAEKHEKDENIFFNTNLTNDTKSINGNVNDNDNFFRSRKKTKNTKRTKIFF